MTFSWNKSSPHVVKVNYKGVFDRLSMKNVVGCVMRNSQREWIRGTSGMIGLVIPVGTEVWSIFYGLKLAWEKGDVRNVVIDCENQEAIHQVNNPDPDFWLADLVMLIKNLENEAYESCVIQNVSEDGNVVVTALANSELDGVGGMMEFADAPSFMEVILAADKA